MSFMLRPVTRVQIKVKWPIVSLLTNNGWECTKASLCARDVIFPSPDERSLLVRQGNSTSDFNCNKSYTSDPNRQGKDDRLALN